MMAASSNQKPGICNLTKVFPPYREYRWFEQHQDFPIELQNSQFSAINAWWFSELSTLIYDNQAYSRKILNNILGIDNNDIHWFDHQGNQAMLVNYQNAQILIFQGTHFPRLTYTDFASLTRTAENILVDDLVLEQIEQTIEANSQSATMGLHKGFSKALGLQNQPDNLWHQITAKLDNSKPLWVAGHSLGGAMATITAMRLPKQVAGLYTYGAPGVGDVRAQQWQKQHLNGKFFRYVNGGDIVCHIMTTSKFKLHFDLYLHAGEEKKLNVQGYTGVFTLFSQLLDRLGVSFLDHSPVYYALGCRSAI